MRRILRVVAAAAAAMAVATASGAAPVGQTGLPSAALDASPVLTEAIAGSGLGAASGGIDAGIELQAPATTGRVLATRLSVCELAGKSCEAPAAEDAVAVARWLWNSTLASLMAALTGIAELDTVSGAGGGDPPPTIPEPGTAGLLGLGLMWLAGRRRFGAG